MKSKQQDLRRLTPAETRDIVTAICEADEDARRDAGVRAAERVASDVNSKFEDLRHARDDAYRLLDDVIADDNLKDKHDEAKQLREKVSRRWDSITNMAKHAMKGANHLVGIKSDFETCEQFTYRVDCYRLCSRVDENGELQEARPDWKRDCT